MTTAGDRVKVFSQRLLPNSTPILLIVLAVLVANAAYLTGFADPNTISWTANISQVFCHGTCARPAIDPNVGFITQALGHLSAMDLLHGHLPWWNYFEGLGQPLVGEMQSAALFPLTLLLALPAGLLWFHICLEILAGLSAYLLARRLGVPAILATAAGALFALNGTYAWLGNSVLNPIAFLPMLVLGIEMLYDGARNGSRKGWYVAAIALALAIVAGFPEVAYFDGLFAGGWAVVRFFDLPREVRLTAARRLGLATLVGLVLALPVLVPFYDFAKVANVGIHTGSVAGVAHLSVHEAPMFFDPYIYGTLLVNPKALVFWDIGGYFTASVSVLALVGLLGRRLRSLRIFLGAWVLAVAMGAFNTLDMRHLWNLLPLVKTATFARYVMPSCELAMILLAVLAIGDLALSPRLRRLMVVSSAFMLVLLAWGVYEARAGNAGLVLRGKTRIFYLMFHAAPFVAVLSLIVVCLFVKPRIAPLAVAGVLILESIFMFSVPAIQAPNSVVVDQSPITFLQRHQGQYRFLDLFVLTPNWGSQYGINSLAAIDLPFPKAFTNLIQTQLYPGLTPDNQFVIHNGLADIIAMQHQVANHFAAYQGTSTKYLMMPPGVSLIPALAALGVHQVFEDDHASIFEIPQPRAFFSAASTSCTVTSTDFDVARVNCPQGPTTLLRTELSMAGWRASVNGHPVDITTVDGVYQKVPIPQGSSTVTYQFLPPHERYAVLAGLLAALFLATSWTRERRPEWFRRRSPVPPRQQ